MSHLPELPDRGGTVRRVAVALLIAVVASACASTPGAAEPTVLRVVMADDWASVPVVGQVIDAFERDHAGVRVEIQPSPFSQIPELVRSAMELGQPFELAHWHAFAAAAADTAEPIDDLWETAGLRTSDYLPGAIEDVTWDGALYGLPLDVNALVLMVNAEQLEEAGLDPEDLRTPERFRAAAATLRSETEAEHAIAVTASSWSAYGWMTAAGGRLIDGTDASGVPRFTFEDPGNVAALELLVDLVASGDAPPPFAPDLSLDAIASFSSGETALHVSGSWDLPVTRRALEEGSAVEDIMVLPLPQQDPANPRTVLGGSSLFIPKGAQHRDLTFELMLALTADDVALALAAQEGRLPPRASVYDDPMFASSPDLAAFVEQLPDANVMPLIAYPEVANAFREGLERTLTQRRTPAEAMAEVQVFADRWAKER
jgi:multiple sugar transport system substrate-binding protein